MMLAPERMDAAYQLSLELDKRDVRKSDLTEIRVLIDAEEEGRTRSLEVANRTTGQESYKKGQAKAADNSGAILDLLMEALAAVKNRNAVRAAGFLKQASTFRSQAKSSGEQRGKSISALYQQYLTETDTVFHSWLAANGYDSELVSLGLADRKPVTKGKKAKRIPKFVDEGTTNTRGRVKDSDEGSSNRPEDY